VKRKIHQNISSGDSGGNSGENYTLAVVSRIISSNAIAFVLIGIVIICFIAIPNFRSATNAINILRQVSALTIIALGQYFVILSGGIDLSAGTTISLIGCLVAGLMYFSDWPLVAALVFAICMGIVIGSINGALVVYGDIQPFIATLATMIAIKGIAFLYSGGFPISGLPEAFGFFGRGYVGKIPVPILIMVAIAIICYFFSEHSITGRNIFAIGGNEDAARVCGIRTKRVKLFVYVIASFLTSIGAIVISSRIMSGQPTVGDNMLFDIITAVVLGGTSLSGGEGKVFGVIAGALILGVIANAMVLLRINPYWQWIIRGIILVIAVYIDSRTKKRIK